MSYLNSDVNLKDLPNNELVDAVLELHSLSITKYNLKVHTLAILAIKELKNRLNSI